MVDDDFLMDPDEEDEGSWGRDMAFGWNLPSLAPWKSLLLIDIHDELDPYERLRGPHVTGDDRAVAEGLIKFLETASVTLSYVLFRGDCLQFC